MGSHLLQQTKKIEKKEKRGSYGAWRKDFCERYYDLLQRIQKNTYNSLIEKLASTGAEVTCQMGCVYCCFHYVTVSLGHGLVIVDYLYKRREVLRQFLDNYKNWERKGVLISDSIDRARIHALSSSVPIDRVIADTRSLAAEYRDTNLRCPFLVDNMCIIYDVRPLSCSSQYSVTSPHWCAPDTPQEPSIHHITPSDEDLSEIIRLAGSRLLLYELTLPTMIYKLLTEGSSSIISKAGQCNI